MTAVAGPARSPTTGHDHRVRPNGGAGSRCGRGGRTRTRRFRPTGAGRFGVCQACKWVWSFPLSLLTTARLVRPRESDMRPTGPGLSREVPGPLPRNDRELRGILCESGTRSVGRARTAGRRRDEAPNVLFRRSRHSVRALEWPTSMLRCSDAWGAQKSDRRAPLRRAFLNT
jgi:hypothetical protein